MHVSAPCACSGCTNTFIFPPSPAPTTQVSGFGGKISLTNTLQSRLMLAYETRLPKLRAALFA